jgi:DNA polymerase-3 subunit gamma/tau
MAYVVLALKWRPQSFDEVAGQDAIMQTLKNAIQLGRTAHAYLFTGPRGVGKTSVARILAKALNCVDGPTATPCNNCDACREITTGRSLDVLEIDGASNRGIDDIRELRESVRYAPASGRAKIYIIDEVHMLTTDAFNALLKTLEEPPSHVVFVLATTEPLKVPTTIVSRCQRYDFSRLRLRDSLERMQMICRAEGIEVNEDALSLIARRAEGSMRDALTLLDQVTAAGKTPIDGPTVTESLGIAGRELYFAISAAILEQDPHRALSLLGTAYGDGQNLQEVAEELVAHLRNLLVLSVNEELDDLVDATDSERERYRAQASRAKPADLIRQLHIAMETATRMRRSAFPRALLEVSLAEICLMPRSADLTAWLQKLPDEAPPAEAPPAHASRRPASAKPAPRRSSGPEQMQALETAVPGAPGGEWDEVIRRIRSRRPALAASLSGTEISGEEGGFMAIRFPPEKAAFGTATLEHLENQSILRSIIHEVYGRPVGWRVDVTQSAAPSNKATEATAPPLPPGGSVPGARSNLDDIQRIARQMDGDVLGPS